MAEQLKTAYGTSAFTAPEFFVHKSRAWTVDEGKCHDVYALGCELYLYVYNLKVLPWASEVARKIANGPDQQKAYAALIADAESCVDPQRKKLLTACVGLLQPDPNNRWAIQQFLQAIQ
jgi:serine/threonine protein kinase